MSGFFSLSLCDTRYKANNFQRFIAELLQSNINLNSDQFFPDVINDICNFFNRLEILFFQVIIFYLFLFSCRKLTKSSTFAYYIFSTLSMNATNQNNHLRQ